MTTGTTSPTLGFQADFTDPASDHVWMGARWYDGGWAAFLSRDTVFGELKTPVSMNRYTYAYANPIAFFDPDGRRGERYCYTIEAECADTGGDVITTEGPPTTADLEAIEQTQNESTAKGGNPTPASDVADALREYWDRVLD